MEEIRRFRILEYLQEQVTFLTFEEMEGALREIHNGRDIYLVLGEKVIYRSSLQPERSRRLLRDPTLGPADRRPGSPSFSQYDRVQPGKDVDV